MGGRKGGRKPVPSVLRELRGNPRHRPLNDEEPIPKSGIDDYAPPDYFNEAQAREWRQVCSEAPPGMLKSLDMAILEAYVVNICLMRDAADEINKSGHLSEGSNGNMVISPYVRILNTASIAVAKFAGELGFTPSSRSRIRVPKEKPAENPFGAFSGPPQAPELNS